MTAADLKARAEAGDPGAQYALAAALDRAGDRDSAALWLEKAAAGGHPGAAYTKATKMLAAPPAEIDAAGAVRLLSAAAERGGLAAARQLAVLKALGLGTPEDWPGAVAVVAQAARGGHPAALRELGALGILSGIDGATALRAAAFKGDGAAGVLGLRHGGVFTDAESEALEMRLKAAGWPLLDDASAAATSRSAHVQSPSPADIDRLAEAARVPLVFSPASAMLRDAEPAIMRCDRLLPRLACDYAVCAAAALLKPSAVVDPALGGARTAAFRTSEGAAIGLLDLDLALVAICRAVCAAVSMTAPQAELMGVLRYRPGQEYRPHHDYLSEDEADYSEVRRAGQRVATLLVALNEGYEGGETRFPCLDLAWRGAAGDGLFFRNTDENERPYPESQHAGAPVARGEKWILTLWFRKRRFWFWG